MYVPMVKMKMDFNWLCLISFLGMSKELDMGHF